MSYFYAHDTVLNHFNVSLLKFRCGLSRWGWNVGTQWHDVHPGTGLSVLSAQKNWNCWTCGGMLSHRTIITAVLYRRRRFDENFSRLQTRTSSLSLGQENDISGFLRRTLNSSLWIYTFILFSCDSSNYASSRHTTCLMTPPPSPPTHTHFYASSQF